MSGRIVLLFCAIAAFTRAYPQDAVNCVDGVFFTESDFIARWVSHKVDTKAAGNKFGFKFPADLKFTVRIAKPDTTLEFRPGSIYGYSQCGRRFRYFEGGDDLLAQEDFYRVEEAAGLIIYSSVFISGNELFYSQGYSTPVRRLLLKNIETDFAGYPEFVGAVKKLNEENLHGELGQHDSAGHFEINRLYARYVLKRK